MARSNRKFIITSLLVHSVAFSFLLPLKGCSGGKTEAAATAEEQKKQEQEKVEITVEEKEEIKPKPIDKPTEEPPPPPMEKSEIPTALAAPPTDQCEKWFGGIGIEMSQTASKQLYVREIYAGYPAAQAGLLPGDIIMSVTGAEIRGPPGTTVTIQIMRGGQLMSFSIVRGRICL